MASLLDANDKKSPLWVKIKTHYEQRLEMLRRKNDKRRSDEETDYLRGRIAEVKELLTLGDSPTPAQEADDVRTY